MKNPYLQFISDCEKLIQTAAQLPLGGLPPLDQPPLAANAPKVLLFSPHPDDECIGGTLPLRLRREQVGSIS